MFPIENQLFQDGCQHLCHQSRLTEKEFEVSKIIDSRINRRRLEYLVHWQGYEVSEQTWEPVANLTNAPKMIKKFHCQYPTKPSAKDI